MGYLGYEIKEILCETCAELDIKHVMSLVFVFMILFLLLLKFMIRCEPSENGFDSHATF